MQLRPTFTLRNLLPTDDAGNSKQKAARCQSAAIVTKTFGLEAISLTFKEKREDYLTLTVPFQQKKCPFFKFCPPGKKNSGAPECKLLVAILLITNKLILYFVYALICFCVMHFVLL